MQDDAVETRSPSDGAAIGFDDGRRVCPGCGKRFRPRRDNQVFHHKSCRIACWKERGQAIEAAVQSLHPVSGGAVVVVLRVQAADRDKVLAFEPRKTFILVPPDDAVAEEA